MNRWIGVWCGSSGWMDQRIRDQSIADFLFLQFSLRLLRNNIDCIYYKLIHDHIIITYWRARWSVLIQATAHCPCLTFNVVSVTHFCEAAAQTRRAVTLRVAGAPEGYRFAAAAQGGLTTFGNIARRGVFSCMLITW